MNKKVFSIMFIVFATVFALFSNPTKVMAASYTSNDGKWVYDKITDSNGDYAAITEYKGADTASITSITIPDSIDGIPVKSITHHINNNRSVSPFNSCTDLSNLTIPNSVTSIEDYAFYRCSKLDNITIPNNVTNIGVSAFESCSNLSTISIPNSVTSIGNYAFYGCSKLDNITIPNNVTSIGNDAFEGTKWFDNLSAHAQDFVVARDNILLKYIGNDVNLSTIPNNVSMIAGGAFENCNNLQNIKMPNSVTSIGDSAFWQCINLQNITIPNSVTSIGNYAFYGCSKLDNIRIPNSVTSIEKYVFDSCTTLQSITMPNSVTSIGDSAFGQCTKLQSITIPNSVTSIGNFAFEDCNNLENIAIPNSVTSIGYNAFWQCSKLQNITIPNSVTSIGDSAFDGCSALTSVTIPNSVTSIGGWAFGGCTTLQSITISNSSASIGDYAFDQCNKLHSVITYLNTSGNKVGTYSWGNNVTVSSTSPQAISTVEAAADTLTPTAGEGDGITLSVKDSAGNLQNSDTQTFNNEAIFGTTTTVAISGVIPTQDGSYGSIAYDDGNGEKTLQLNSDSASANGQEFKLKFTDGQAKFKLVLNNTARQAIEFNVGGIANPQTPVLNMVPKAQIPIVTPTSDSGGSGGDGGSISSSKSVTGSIIDNITGKKISDVNADVTTYYNGKSTVSMDMSKVIEVKQPDGSTEKLDDISKISVLGSSGSYIPISSNGLVQIDNLIKGTDNNFKIAYDFGNGQKINIGSIDIKIGTDGSVSFNTTLIDPYGKIVDEATGKAVEGAKVTLYYANTERNKTSGKTPDAEVSLQKIDGFKPNNNVNPQSSNSYGAYGFMVFPDTDYYMVVEKDGYNKYTSPTISVGKDIVKWNVDLHISGTERLYGQDRIDTNLQITKAAFPNGFSNVVLASSENYPDALSGSVLSYKLNAPILLVGSSDTDKAKVFSYLESNISTDGTVYILGGTGSIGKDVEDKLSSDGFKNIVRIGGQDRFETAVKIDDKIGAKEGTPVVIVSGENYPDALSISSIAAQNGYPIFMTPKDKIPDEVKEKVSALKPSKVYIIGLEGVISKNVENQISGMTSLDSKNIIRIGGKDRFETSLDVAKYFGLSGSIECAASGTNFPDALSGSIYAAENKAHVILVGDKLSNSEVEYLKNSKLSGITIFGGNGAVSAEVQEDISKAISK